LPTGVSAPQMEATTPRLSPLQAEDETFLRTSQLRPRPTVAATPLLVGAAARVPSTVATRPGGSPGATGEVAGSCRRTDRCWRRLRRRGPATHRRNPAVDRAKDAGCRPNGESSPRPSGQNWTPHGRHQSGPDGTTLAAPETGQTSRAGRFGRLTGQRAETSLDTEFYLLISCYRERHLPKGRGVFGVTW
jgi:hypothetical protein